MIRATRSNLVANTFEWSVCKLDEVACKLEALYFAKIWLMVLFMPTCFDIRRQTRTTHINWANVPSDLKKFPHTQFVQIYKFSGRIKQFRR